MKIKTDFSTSIQYKILFEKPFLILKRKKGDELTVPCPFCGTGHIHGAADGHRLSHCASGSKEFVTADDGTILYKQAGYIIVTE